MLPSISSRKFLLTHIFIILLALKPTYQRGDGAPAGACIDHTPVHHGIPFQASTPPYSIKVDQSQVKQGGTLRVLIDGQAPVGGFIMQARKVQKEDEIVGKFTSVPNQDLERIFSCRGENDTVTHSTPADKHNLVFEWQAPNDFLGGVFFRATVAQNFATFWKNVDSNIFEVVTEETVITTTEKVLEAKSTVNGPPSIIRLQPTEKPKLDRIYDGCGDIKLCFGTPSGCIQNGNCKAIVAVLVASEKYTFELQGTDNPKYVAGGLSYDQNMGDDSAMECVQNNGVVKLYSSWTYPKEEPYVTRKNVPQSILNLESGSYNDGKIYCRFTRDTVTSVMDKTFDLVNGRYNLMVVAGSSMKDAERVGFHDIAFEKSSTPLALSVVGAVEGSTKLLTKVHGGLMIGAWLFLASIGVVLARYYRQTWVGKQFAGKDVWFVWHRLLMFLTVTMTIAGFIVILIEVGTYRTTGDNPHAITGLVTVILAVIQPIGAFFRPHPGTSKRPWFNWIHWFLGNSTHILAIATIFLAVYLPKAELPSWTLWILVAYVAFHVLTHLLLSVFQCASGSRSLSRIDALPMKDLRRPHSQPIHTSHDERFGSFRRSMLGVYASIICLIVILLICLVALAPIEETYSNVTDMISNAMGN